MSQNLKLVKYFISQFYEERSLELAHIVSPRFYFIVNSSGKLSFEEYAERMNEMYKTSKSFVTDLRSDDDQTFFADYIIVTEVDGYSEKLCGIAKYYVLNGLLESVHINRHNDEKEMKRLLELMDKDEELCTSYFV